jgi:uncharacterized iron-regulated membrane protein
MRPLHVGGALGQVGRALVLIGGLALVLLSATGFIIWLRRRQQQRRRAPRALAPKAAESRI